MSIKGPADSCSSFMDFAESALLPRVHDIAHAQNSNSERALWYMVDLRFSLICSLDDKERSKSHRVSRTAVIFGHLSQRYRVFRNDGKLFGKF